MYTYTYIYIYVIYIYIHTHVYIYIYIYSTYNICVLCVYKVTLLHCALLHIAMACRMSRCPCSCC